jgi:hypothetical protein
MPFITVKIQPGVKTVATPTLLNANIVASNLIRWRGGLPEKFGGWSNFIQNLETGGPGNETVPGTTRDMWAWSDLDLDNHLAVAGTAGVNVLTPASGGAPPYNQDIRPQYVISTGLFSVQTDGGQIPNFVAANTYPGQNQLTFLASSAGRPPLGGIQVGYQAADYYGFAAGGGMGSEPTFSIVYGTTVQSIDSDTQLSLSAPVVAPGVLGTAAGAANGESDEPQFYSPATTITIQDTSNITLSIGDSVTFQTHIPLGTGQVLFGTYEIQSFTANFQGTDDETGNPVTVQQYTINAPAGWFGEGAAGGSHGAGMGAITFTTTAGSPVIGVSLPPNAANVGDTFTVVLPTTVGGITLQGFYQIYSIRTNTNGWTNGFTIMAEEPAISADTQYEGNLGTPPNELNDGTPSKAQVLYWIAQKPPPQYTYIPSSPFPPLWTSPDYNNPAFGNATGDDWSLANLGSTLLAAARNGPLFEWDPTSGIPNLKRIPQAPDAITGFFVGMPEQQIICYGASTDLTLDPLLVAWSDNADYTVWIAAVDNQAGTYRLSRGSKIVGGIQGPQQAMLWTDVGLWAMAYIGYPDVFGFNEIAQGCGLIGKHAMAVYGPQVFWMSRDGFWVYSNGAVQRLPCDVWDVVIKNINNTRDANGDYIYWEHIRAGANSDYDEVAWHFPSMASTNGENDSIVKLNTVTGEWDYSFSIPQQGMVGNTPLPITEWIDNNIFGHPISAMIGQTTITMATTAAAAAGSTTLTFAGPIPQTLRGTTVVGVTNPSSIAAGTGVQSITTLVTTAAAATSQPVKAGDVIQFIDETHNKYAPTGFAPALVQTSGTVLTFSANLSGVFVGNNVIDLTASPNSPWGISGTTVAAISSTQMTLNVPLAGNVNVGDVIEFAGTNSMIQQHEMSPDANGQPINWMIQTGFFMLSDGEDKVFADYMLPDFRWRRWQQPQSTSATIQITLYTAEEPDDPQDTWVPYGPYTVTNASGGVEVRARGRYFMMEAQGNDLGSFVRLGGIKFRIAPDGRN